MGTSTISAKEIATIVKTELDKAVAKLETIIKNNRPDNRLAFENLERLITDGSKSQSLSPELEKVMSSVNASVKISKSIISGQIMERLLNKIAQKKKVKLANAQIVHDRLTKLSKDERARAFIMLEKHHPALLKQIVKIAKDKSSDTK